MIASTLAKGLFAAAIAIAAPGVAFALPDAGATLRRPVAMGCGIGRTRDATGRCRHRFNLFDHHDRRRFHDYRADHCTTVQTPNGRVRRCRI